MLRTGLVGSLLCVALLAGPTAAAEKLDLSALEGLPVLHAGRIMPLDTLARDVVQAVCHVENPTLSLEGALYHLDDDGNLVRLDPDDPQVAERLKLARPLFPDGKPRKFRALELFLSWLVEPEAWEEIPFLHAEYETLRTDYLGLPSTNEPWVAEHPQAGVAPRRFKYVSPEQLRRAEKFHRRFSELLAQRDEANRTGETFRPEGTDEKLFELASAFELWARLGFSSEADRSRREVFQKKLVELSTAWQHHAPRLEGLQKFAAGSPWGEYIQQTQAYAQQVFALGDKPQLDLAEDSQVLAAFAEANEGIAEGFRQLKELMAKDPPAGAEALDAAQRMNALVAHSEEIARLSRELLDALFDNNKLPRVVPKIDANLLEVDRIDNGAHPWLDLQTLLFAPPAALHGHSTQNIQAVRRAFLLLRDAFQAREDTSLQRVLAQLRDTLAEHRRSTLDVPPDPTDRSQAVGAAGWLLASSIRRLGEAANAARDNLAYQKLDRKRLEQTAYPPPDATRLEVRYNKLQPFMWSWVISLLSVAGFGLAFGKLHKPMYWVGLAILVGSILWSIYGFSMRVRITGWAPVTDMYETMIYVPLFVSILGVWFALLPVTWEGIRAAWRFSAIPGTWEAQPLTEVQRRIASPETYWLCNVLMMGPRLALMVYTFLVLAIWEYQAGGHPILPLLPQRDVGYLLPDANKFMVWLAGMFIFWPTLWYLPRIVLTALAAPITVPLSLGDGRFRQWLPAVYPRKSILIGAAFVAFLGTHIAWWAGASEAVSGDFKPLNPVLRDNFWLTIHVLTIVSSYGAGALAWALGNLALGYYLLGRYRRVGGGQTGSAQSAEAPPVAPIVRPPEATTPLVGYVYKAIQVAVLLLAAGTILGGLWADVSWGRFWGWDPKEVWALISLLVYLGILHGRYAGWFGNFGLAVGSVMGFTAIIMSWYGVNFVLGVGLHSYGFGTGGQWQVGACVLANWLFVGLTALRYWAEMSNNPQPPLRPEYVDDEQPEEQPLSTPQA